VLLPPRGNDHTDTTLDHATNYTTMRGDADAETSSRFRQNDRGMLRHKNALLLSTGRHDGLDGFAQASLVTPF